MRWHGRSRTDTVDGERGCLDDQVVKDRMWTGEAHHGWALGYAYRLLSMKADNWDLDRAPTLKDSMLPLRNSISVGIPLTL